jgi:hypothetical protein
LNVRNRERLNLYALYRSNSFLPLGRKAFDSYKMICSIAVHDLSHGVLDIDILDCSSSGIFPPAAAILGSSIATAVVNNNCVRLRLLTKEHE